MNSVRNFFRRLFRPRRSRTGGSETHPDKPRVEFSYTVYWTKQARGWDAVRRLAVREALRRTLAQPGFEPNAYQRRYTVPGLDDSAHSGASLAALNKVLTAFIDD